MSARFDKSTLRVYRVAEREVAWLLYAGVYAKHFDTDPCVTMDWEPLEQLMIRSVVWREVTVSMISSGPFEGVRRRLVTLNGAMEYNTVSEGMAILKLTVSSNMQVATGSSEWEIMGCSISVPGHPIGYCFGERGVQENYDYWKRRQSQGR